MESFIGNEGQAAFNTHMATFAAAVAVTAPLTARVDIIAPAQRFAVGKPFAKHNEADAFPKRVFYDAGIIVLRVKPCAGYGKSCGIHHVFLLGAQRALAYRISDIVLARYLMYGDELVFKKARGESI